MQANSNIWTRQARSTMGTAAGAIFLTCLGLAVGCQADDTSAEGDNTTSEAANEAASNAAASSGGANSTAASSTTSDSGALSTTGATPNPGDIAGEDAIEAPAAEADIELPPATAFGEPVLYRPNRSSVRLYLPYIEGAQDYRAFAVQPGVSVSSSEAGGVLVEGATIACAGLRQTNHCDSSEMSSGLGQAFDVPDCDSDPRASDLPKEVLRIVELDGLTGPTTVVVEALDRLCPFPGAFGHESAQLNCMNEGRSTSQGIFQDSPVDWLTCPESIPIRDEAEIRAQYGSLIINGQRPPSVTLGPGLAESPFAKIGLPAEADALGVLARAVVQVEPLGTDLPPAGFGDADFFTDFSDASDQPQLVSDAPILANGLSVINPRLFQNSDVNVYSYGAERDGAQAFISQGTLRLVLADWNQDIMASNIVYPRRAFTVPEASDAYVHVTFEVQTNASQRRYFWLHACGAETPGATVVDGQLAAEAGIYPYPFFMDPDVPGNISSAGWNCLQWVPRGGGYERIAGDPTLGRARPQTDIRVLINDSTPDLTPSNLRSTFSVRNISPDMYGNNDPEVYGTWLRQWDAQQNPVGVLLDDDMYIEQRTRFDVFFNRTRTVLYANGVQKICNDFAASQLSMAEAAIGLGHVLYHSSAERIEFLRSDWVRTGQHYYRHNTPFLDHRSIDNFGVRENAALPEGFEDGQCYVY